MPKNPEDIKAEEAARIRQYYDNNDAAGLMAHMEEVYGRTSNDDLFDSPEIAAFTDFIKMLEENRSRENNAFFLDIMANVGKRRAELTLEVGRKAEDIREQIRNGEVGGLELIVPEQDKLDQAAMMFAVTKTPIGKKLLAVQNINMMIRDAAFSSIRNTDRFSKKYSDTYDATIDADPRFDAETKKRYRKADAQVDKSIEINSSMDDHLENGKCVLDADEGDAFEFTKMPDLYAVLKQMSDKELEDHINTLESDLRTIQAYDSVLKNFGDKAKSFAKSLEEQTDPKTKETDEYKKLRSALLNCPMSGGVPAEREYIYKKMDTALEAAANFPDEKIRAAILKEFGEEKRKIDKALSDGAEAVIRKNGVRTHSSSSLLGKDIARAKAEQDFRALQRSEKTVEETKALNEQIKTRTAEQDEIIAFKEMVKSSIAHATHRINVLDQDKNSRGISDADKGKHRDYFAMTDSSKGLTEMDPDKLSPAEILQRMRDAKAAADRYVQTHAGILNITKGWTSEARERIADARNFSESIDKQIKALEASANTLEEKVGKGKSLGDRYAELAAEKKALRSETSAKRLAVLTTPEVQIKNRLKKYETENLEFARKRAAGEQGTMPESASLVAGESLRKLQNAAGIDHPFTENQKSTVLKHIGRVVAYDTKMYREMQNKDEKGFKKFVGNVDTNEAFVKAVSQTIGEINQENVRKFCADPQMSMKIRDNFVKIRQDGLDEAEKELNNNQPKPELKNRNQNLNNPEHGIGIQ